MQITLFPLGGHFLISRDFTGPDKEDEEVKEALRARQRSRILLFQRCLRFVFRPLFRGSATPSVQEKPHQYKDEEMVISKEERTYKPSDEATTTVTEVPLEIATTTTRARHHHHRHVSFGSHTESSSHHHRRDSSLPRLDEEGLVEEKGKGPLVSPGASTYGGNDMSMLSPTATMIMTEKHTDGFFPPQDNPKPAADADANSSSSSKKSKILFPYALSFLHSLLAPATITMALAFPIALVKPLKALFVEMENSPIPNAPDGKPPLYFILDTASFLGAASVPLGLVCLGAALAKLKVPKTINSLPVGAIASMAVGKLIVSPILGVLIVNGFVKIGFIREEDKVLRFVTM